MKAAIELAVRLAAAPHTEWNSPHARGLAAAGDHAHGEDEAP